MYKFAIVGCGRIAERHAEQINAVGKLVAVCDIIPERATSFANRYGVQSYTCIDALLKEEKELDIVSICTPNGLHAEHSIKTLQAGVHVLCEKPLCITSAAAWQLLETEKFSRRKLFVVKSTRYNPYLKQLKKMISSKMLGEIFNFQLSCFWTRPPQYYHDWHGKLFPDGGTLYTQFSHYIDAILWLFGDLETATGFAANLAHKEVMEFEDSGVAALRMQNGILGTVNWSVNSYKKNFEIALTVLAEKGTICLGGAFLNEVKYELLESPLSFERSENEPNDYKDYKGSMSNHKEVYEQLIQAMDKKDNGFPNSYDGLKTVEAIEKIYKAVHPTFLF